jgi:hypothetical protein
MTKLLPLPKNATAETREVYATAKLSFPNTEEGFRSATETFGLLMEYALGTDEGKEVNEALDSARWYFQDKYQAKYGWDLS